MLTLAADARSNLPQVAMLGGLVLIIGALMWNSTRRRRARPEAHTHVHSEQHNYRLQQQARHDVDELMVRLEEVSRELCGKIDTRFAKLERVIAEADQRLESLRTAVRRQAAGAEAAGPGQAPPADPKHLEVCRRHAEGQGIVSIAREMGMAAGEVELILSLERSRQAGSSIPDND